MERMSGLRVRSAIGAQYDHVPPRALPAARQPLHDRRAQASELREGHKAGHSPTHQPVKAPAQSPSGQRSRHASASTSSTSSTSQQERASTPSQNPNNPRPGQQGNRNQLSTETFSESDGEARFNSISPSRNPLYPGNDAKGRDVTMQAIMAAQDVASLREALNTSPYPLKILHLAAAAASLSRLPLESNDTYEHQDSTTDTASPALRLMGTLVTEIGQRARGCNFRVVSNVLGAAAKIGYSPDDATMSALLSLVMKPEFEVRHCGTPRGAAESPSRGSGLDPDQDVDTALGSGADSGASPSRHGVKLLQAGEGSISSTPSSLRAAHPPPPSERTMLQKSSRPQVSRTDMPVALSHHWKHSLASRVIATHCVSALGGSPRVWDVVTTCLKRSNHGTSEYRCGPGSLSLVSQCMYQPPKEAALCCT